MSGALHQNTSYTPDEKKTQLQNLNPVLVFTVQKTPSVENMHSGTCGYFLQETVLKAVID